MVKKIIVVGSGNAGLSAGIAALEAGASVLMLEKGTETLAGGNTKYTAGAMRFDYDGLADLLPLLANPTDERIARTDFGRYTKGQFANDLIGFNEGRGLSPEQDYLIAQAYDAVKWLASHGVVYEPIYARQSFEKNGKIIFWGGLTLAAHNEGVGLYEMERTAFQKLGGALRFNAGVTGLMADDNRVTGVLVGDERIAADAVILACGGFEADAAMRRAEFGAGWGRAKVRGTPHNTGDGLALALGLGAMRYGKYDGCHATPMDLHMKDFGNLGLPPKMRKNYRKICYFLGVMVNAEGRRFVDEGINFRNYTYAQFGRAVLEQPGGFAWQIFDAKVFDLLYEEYRFEDAHFVEADSLGGLVAKLYGVNEGGVNEGGVNEGGVNGDKINKNKINKNKTLKTLKEFNAAVDDSATFDPTTLDGKATIGLELNKSNWAQRLDTPPFRAYPVTGGITFTYGGLKVDDLGRVMSEASSVLSETGSRIEGLHACGEIIGGVFFGGYPGGSGLTSGTVFGRKAGLGAARG